MAMLHKFARFLPDVLTTASRISRSLCIGQPKAGTANASSCSCLGPIPSPGESAALRYAAEFGHARCVAILLPLSEPEALNSYALRWAATNGHVECVKLLIPNPLAEHNEFPALCMAASKNNFECVKLLIPVSNAKQDDSYALRIASARGHAECVKLLAPVSEPGVRHHEALRMAAKNGHAECVGLLLPFLGRIGADNILLASALENGRHEIVGLILEREAELLEVLDFPLLREHALRRNLRIPWRSSCRIAPCAGTHQVSPMIASTFFSSMLLTMRPK